MPGAAQPLHLQDRRLLVDLRARPGGGLRQPAGELADVQPGALGVDHRPVVEVAADLRAQLALGHHLGLVAQPFGQHVVGLAEAVEMGRLRGQVHLAGAREVAVDPLLADELLDRVDRVVVGEVERAGGREPVAGDRVPEADRQARGSPSRRCARKHPRPPSPVRRRRLWRPCGPGAGPRTVPVRPAPTTATSTSPPTSVADRSGPSGEVSSQYGVYFIGCSPLGRVSGMSEPVLTDRAAAAGRTGP